MSITTNFYLEKKLELITKNGVVIGLPDLESLTDGSYIINLNNEHWTALYMEHDTIIYHDSFGVVPPMKIIHLMQVYSNQMKSKLKYYYNTIDIQNIHSGFCGLYCILFLYIMNHKKGALLKRLKYYQSLFKSDPTKNLEILKTKLHKYNLIN